MALIPFPDSYWGGLQKLAALSDEAFVKFASALDKISAIIKPRRMTERIAEHVPDLPLEDVRDIVYVVMALHSVRLSNNMKVDQFINDVRETIDRSGRKLSEDTNKNILLQRIVSVLSNKSLLVAAKATQVQRQHGSVFGNSRILTDMRPIFSDDEPMKLEGALLVHIMKFTYFGDSGDMKEFYLALDSDDLKDIRKDLDKAEEKAKILRQHMTSSNLPDFDC